MIRAALKEVQTTPLAALGALAGILSFSFVVLGPSQYLPDSGATAGNTNAAIALTTLALVVPATGFFFAFVAHLFFLGGLVRGALISVVLLLIAQTFGATAPGAVLSAFSVEQHSVSPSQLAINLGHGAPGIAYTVLGIDLGGIALAIASVNALLFAAIIGETIWAQAQVAVHGPGEQDEYGDALAQSDARAAYLAVSGFLLAVVAAISSLFVTNNVLHAVVAP